MITPGFFGFFNAQRALITAQNAMSTINHNIANVNTQGYSRQRVEISAFDPYQAPGYQGLMGGQIGQGSMVDEVIRIRDAFLDDQYRISNSTLGFDAVKRDVLAQIEGILAEPSDSGINAAVSRFFDSAQELSLHPESIPVRQDFIQSAADLVTVVTQITTQLYDLRTNIVGDAARPATVSLSQAALTVTEINEKIRSIADLNKQIVTVFASGAQPNDLMDQRDRLIDELSHLVDIDVVQRERGLVDISIGVPVTPPPVGQPSTITVVRGGDVVETLEYVVNPFGNVGIDGNQNLPGIVRTVGSGIFMHSSTQASRITSGKLAGLIQMGRGDQNALPAQTLPYESVRTIMQDINNFMASFTAQVNTIQVSGRDINGNDMLAANPQVVAPPLFGTPIFQLPLPLPLDPVNGVMQYRVTPALFMPDNGITQGPGRIAAALNDPAAPGPPLGFAGPGDGRNALRFAQLRDTDIAALGTMTFTEFMNGRISSVGIQSRTFQDRTSGQEDLINSLDQRRQSVSGVNTDEETIDLIRFQRMFEASSRVIKTFDEIMETIINMV